jgi:hypothetical protein
MLLTPKLAKFSAGLGIVLSILAGCSSSDPTNVAADFSAQGIKGKIEGEIVVIDLSDLGNCATTIENMTIAAETFGASVSPDPRVARDYSKPVDFTITAPDGTSATFKVTVKAEGCIPTPAPVQNTPLVLGEFNCYPVQRMVPFALNAEEDEFVTYAVCEISATDPDGVADTEFNFLGPEDENLNFAIQDRPKVGSTYSIGITCPKVIGDDVIVTFQATGLMPDNSQEAPMSKSIQLSKEDLCSSLGQG